MFSSAATWTQGSLKNLQHTALASLLTYATRYLAIPEFNIQYFRGEGMPHASLNLTRGTLSLGGSNAGLKHWQSISADTGSHPTFPEHHGSLLKLHPLSASVLA